MKPTTPLWLASQLKNAILERVAPLKSVESQGLKFYYLRSDSPPHDPESFSSNKLEFHHKIRRLSGKVAIDVGANIGSYAIRLTKQFETVVAFEPNPSICRILRLNVTTSKLSNVKVREVALSDMNETVPLFLRGGGATSLSASHYGLAYKKVTYIQAVRLDDLGYDGKLDFLKIDAEGSELSVLRGGRQTIEKNRPVMGIEVHHGKVDSQGTCACETCEYLRECDYVLDITGELTPPTPVHWVWATSRP